MTKTINSVQQKHKLMNERGTPSALLYIFPSASPGHHRRHHQRLLCLYAEERSSASPETV